MRPDESRGQPTVFQVAPTAVVTKAATSRGRNFVVAKTQKQAFQQKEQSDHETADLSIMK